MQSNRSQSRSNWKQAVRKDNPVESRIFGVNRELPNKFSPARLNTNNQTTARSLIKHKSNNYSHDQFAIAAILSESRERSSSREPRLERKPTEKLLGAVDGDGESPEKPRLQSLKSIDKEIKRLSLKPNKQEDLDIVRELKLEFLRFKEKVLKELRKQEDDLKAAIQQIYDRVGRFQSCSESPIQFRSSPVSQKPSAYAISSVSFDGLQSPISKYLETLSKQALDTINEVKSSGKTEAITIIQQSFTSQIKQRMTKFEELLNNLKRDLNTQLPIDSPSTANQELNDNT